MPSPTVPAPKFFWLRHVSKGVAVIASTGAALVSIVTALYSYGVIGNRESHETIGNFGAAWVRLGPVVDTANAIGDTVRFAATIADKKGSILIGAAPTWTTGDTNIAVVAADGSVIARGAGSTIVTVTVGQLISRARVVVRQKVAGVVIDNTGGDTTVSLVEGGQLQLRARALDSRGHTVAGRLAAWRIDDSSVATIDGRGIITAVNGGRSVVSVNVEGASSYLPIAVETPASSITAVSGGNQHALAGRLLPQRIVVRATNKRGSAAVGKLVTFRLQGARGKVDPDTARTDADGRARTQWTLDDSPGPQTLVATVANVDSAALIEAEAEPVAENTRVIALIDTVRARSGTELVDPVAVRVTDSTGRALAGVPVRWAATDGALEVVAARSDSAGIARARWTLGARTGAQQVRAFIGAAESRIPPAIIKAVALAGVPANIVVVSGDRQRAPAGVQLAKPIVLRVVDAAGNGAADVQMVLSPSGGQLTDTSLVTDSLGYARLRWTMGRVATEYSLAAHVGGITKPTKLTAKATAAAPANLSFDDVASSKGSARKLVAIVTDIYGNPIADSPVGFTVKAGAVTPARAVTDAKGRVMLTWTMSTTATEQTLTGNVRGSDVKGAYVATVKQAGAPRAPKTSPHK
jgi:adhesin/invasin